MVPSSTLPPIWTKEFSCPYMVKLGPQIIVFFCVCSKRVPGTIKLLSSLPRMWVSCHHCFIVLGACLGLLFHGFVDKQARLVLCLSKPAFSSNH